MKETTLCKADEKTQNRAKRTAEAVQEWLRSAGSPLREAVARTLDEGLFFRSDLYHQLRVLSQTTSKQDLLRWVDTHAIASPINPKTILAVHAGNLPLVAFQDILAVTLSGHWYAGKLSSADPYLPKSLLEVLESAGLLTSVRASLDWADLDGLEADAMLFSGAEETLELVQERLSSREILREGAPILSRTAHFSIAYFDLGGTGSTASADAMVVDLAEAICRYQGNGCRSVGIIVSPTSLDDLSCTLTDHLELCLMNSGYGREDVSGGEVNGGDGKDREDGVDTKDGGEATGQQAKTTHKAKDSLHTQEQALHYRYAYHKVLGRSQLTCGPVLITEAHEIPSIAGEVFWIRGDEKTFVALAKSYRANIQSVYTKTAQTLPDGTQTEPLHLAQSPPVDWKPDGIDVLRWISDSVG